MTRDERHSKLRAEMESNGCRAIEVSYSVGKASLLGLCCSAPLALLIGFGWFGLFAGRGINIYDTRPFVVLLIAFLASAFAHEALHCIGWRCAGKLRPGCIHIAMGVFFPSCHCSAPMKGRAYLAGVLLPVAVLGFAPAVASFAAPNLYLMFFAVLGILASGGDLLLSVRAAGHLGDMIADHPSRVGFVSFKKTAFPLSVL